jgi:hypothetical protein
MAPLQEQGKAAASTKGELLAWWHGCTNLVCWQSVIGVECLRGRPCCCLDANLMPDTTSVVTQGNKEDTHGC